MALLHLHAPPRRLAPLSPQRHNANPLRIFPRGPPRKASNLNNIPGRRNHRSPRSLLPAPGSSHRRFGRSLRPPDISRGRPNDEFRKYEVQVVQMHLYHDNSHFRCGVQFGARVYQGRAPDFVGGARHWRDLRTAFGPSTF